jgi:hypothetical protein
MQPAIGVSAVSLAGVHTRQEAAALASSGERLLGQAPAGKSVLEVTGGADDVFPVDCACRKPPSTSCDQVIFVDQATDAGLSSDAVPRKIDRLG